MKSLSGEPEPTAAGGGCKEAEVLAFGRRLASRRAQTEPPKPEGDEATWRFWSFSGDCRAVAVREKRVGGGVPFPGARARARERRCAVPRVLTHRPQAHVCACKMGTEADRRQWNRSRPLPVAEGGRRRFWSLAGDWQAKGRRQSRQNQRKGWNPCKKRRRGAACTAPQTA